MVGGGGSQSFNSAWFLAMPWMAATSFLMLFIF
jgi:hypothetical protein